MSFLLLCTLSLTLSHSARPSQESGPAAREAPLVVLEREARAITPLVDSRLGWDQGASAIDLKADLFAMYSLLEKPKTN